METSASLAPLHSVPSADPADKIRHLPAPAQAAFHTFRATGDVTVLDPLLFAILENFAARTLARPLAEYPGDTLLLDGLGFDSLAITEIVFFTEELFGISIANIELLPVRSLDDLRAFVRAKIAARASA